MRRLRRGNTRPGQSSEARTLRCGLAAPVDESAEGRRGGGAEGRRGGGAEGRRGGGAEGRRGGG